MATYPMHVAGLDRDFPICKVTDDLYIGAFIMFGDAELTVRCAEELLKLAEGIDYDYLFTAEAKSIPLIHEMARQSGAKKYFIARKGPKVYMPDPISVEDKSITTVAQQKLFLGSDDADLIRGKKATDAVTILKFAPQAAALPVRKTLESAIANARVKADKAGEPFRENDLYIKETYVDEGVTLKRFRARAQGRAARINKRTSHITVVVANKEGAR